MQVMKIEKEPFFKIYIEHYKNMPKTYISNLVIKQHPHNH